MPLLKVPTETASVAPAVPVEVITSLPEAYDAVTLAVLPPWVWIAAAICVPV